MPRRPRTGRPVAGLGTVWTAGWSARQVRATGTGSVALAVIGVCGADDRQVREALEWVRARRWRELTRWPGSYLVVARSGPTLVVIGDLSGQHPVYWRRRPGGTWWATSATALAALGDAPVDPVALAAHLAFGQPDVLAERTLFREVRRVPTGHLLEVGPGGARTIRYEPLSYAPVLLEEAGPAVRTALTEAVAARRDDRPVSADLAGLDSTTVACLAARHRPVTAVTFADPRLRDDDLPYARRTAAAVPLLHHHEAPGTPHTLYYAQLAPEDIAALPFTDAPHAYTVTAAIKRSVLDTVRTRQGPGVHLTGVAGDGVLSAPDAYLADLLRERRYRHAWRHAQGHARLRQTSVRTLADRIRPAARHDLPTCWRQTAALLRRAPRPWVPQAQRPLAWTPLLATADWMPPTARHQLADALTAAADSLIEAPTRLADWTDNQDLARVGANAAGWRALALAEHGIDIATPYLDNEVRRACLAVPAEQRGAPGRFKPLLAAAFADTSEVPGFVLARTTKGGFNALSYAGLARHAATVRNLLGPSSRLGALGLVTEAPVVAMLRRAATGQPTAQGALHTAVATEVWLRRLHHAAPAWWEVTGRVATA
ncbi:albusnodin/ikarugamycin family macrolactam cyclase [Streptomyces sp. NPDC003077]|uniref:albusnodin/ikarugamycin family macrolactam cyclase n=1 Tax=Streptomyces sp. NPDC003077 TaxID=3154443 RepID=UPI0033A8FACB